MGELHMLAGAGNNTRTQVHPSFATKKSKRRTPPETVKADDKDDSQTDLMETDDQHGS